MCNSFTSLCILACIVVITSLEWGCFLFTEEEPYFLHILTNVATT